MSLDSGILTKSQAAMVCFFVTTMCHDGLHGGIFREFLYD